VNPKYIDGCFGDIIFNNLFVFIGMSKDIRKYISLIENYQLRKNKEIGYTIQNTPTSDAFSDIGEIDTVTREERFSKWVLEKIPTKKIVNWGNRPISVEKNLEYYNKEDKGNGDNHNANVFDYFEKHLNDLEPIIVLENPNKTYEVVDGEHRVTYYLMKNIPEIIAWVGKARLS
jgi:hypothetical protein